MEVKITVPIVLFVVLMGTSIDASSPLPPVMSYFSRVQETMWQKAFPDIPVDALVAAKFRPEPSTSIFRFNIDEAFGIVSKSPHLIWLDASGRDVTDQHIRGITGYKRLRYLNLADTKVSVGAAVALLRSLPSLQLFVFSGDEKTAARFEEFRPRLQIRLVAPRQRVVYLPEGISLGSTFTCSVPDSIRQRLVDRRVLREEDFAWHAFQQVRISTDFAASESTRQAFEELSNMPGVQVVDGFERQLTRGHLERLAGINTVVYLGLSRTRVEADDVPLVNRLRGLIYLHLDDTQVTPESIATLQKHPTLKYLIVDVPGSLSEEQLAALKGLSAVEVAFRNALPGELRAYGSVGWHPRLGAEDLQECREFPNRWGGFKVGAFWEIEGVTIDKPLTEDLAAELKKLPHLHRLQFQYVALDSEDVRRFQRFPRLTSLTLSSCSFEPPDLMVLSSLEQLEELYLTRDTKNKARPLDGNTVVSWLPMRRLKRLALSGIKVHADAFAAIAKLQSLDRLVLSEVDAPTDFVDALQNSNTMRSIYVGSMRIDRGTLLGLKKLAYIDAIHLSNLTIDPDGILALIAAPNLKELALTHTNVSQSTVDEIRSARPSLKLTINPTPTR